MQICSRSDEKGKEAELAQPPHRRSAGILDWPKYFCKKVLSLIPEDLETIPPSLGMARLLKWACSLTIVQLAVGIEATTFLAGMERRRLAWILPKLRSRWMQLLTDTPDLQLTQKGPGLNVCPERKRKGVVTEGTLRGNPDHNSWNIQRSQRTIFAVRRDFTEVIDNLSESKFFGIGPRNSENL